MMDFQVRRTTGRLVHTEPLVMFRLVICITIAGLMVGCASQGGNTQADNWPPANDHTPTHPTSVVRANNVLQGAVLPDFHETMVSYTRADRRTNDGHLRFDSGWVNWLMGNAHGADIFRLDQGLAYKVLFSRQQYYKCNFKGTDCPTLLNLMKRLGQSSSEPEQKDKTYQPEGTDECPLTLSSHGLAVRETGNTKTINGFATKQYHATFTAVLEDAARRKDTNTLQADFWTTPATGDIKKIWALHQKTIDRYLKDTHGKPNPLARFVPRDVFQALDAFSGDTNSANYQWHNELTRKLAQIKGYPVDIQLNWYVTANACPDKTDTADNNNNLSGNPLDALKNMVGGMVERNVESHFKPKPGEPVFHYEHEVTSARIEPVHDSVFAVPAGYTQRPIPRLPTNKQ